MQTSDKKTIAIYSTAGALAGGIYGFKHPSSKTLDKIDALTQPSSVIYKNYHDSFNKQAVVDAVLNGELDLDTSQKIYKTIDSIKNVENAEIIVEKLLDTPKSKRSQTLKSAIDDANSAHKVMRQEIKFLKNTELFKKLLDLKIINPELFLETLNKAKKDVIVKYKLLSKNAIFGAIGGAAGFALVGLGLKSLFNKNAEKTSK